MWATAWTAATITTANSKKLAQARTSTHIYLYLYQYCRDTVHSKCAKSEATHTLARAHPRSLSVTVAPKPEDTLAEQLLSWTRKYHQIMNTFAANVLNSFEQTVYLFTCHNNQYFSEWQTLAYFKCRGEIDIFYQILSSSIESDPGPFPCSKLRTSQSHSHLCIKD